MNQRIKGSTNVLTCNVCKVNFSSNADYALHEFSKKHCNNLIRLAKPVKNKQKTRSKSSEEEEKESSKINAVTQTGSFAKYKFFIPGEIYEPAHTSKEFNTDYNPYLQKFAENPFKEKPVIYTLPETATVCSVTSFSTKRKKKIKKCQVCNVTLSSVPEYKAHMKSLQHIWKLKITGMGVSAHFIKASSDLHATNINGESTSNNQTSNEQTLLSTTRSNKNELSGPFPLLYCSDCELLFNSLQQYNAHISGKFHIDCAQKKTELKAKKDKLENPSPNQLYCYSCKISLNNLLQYNEHKNGKKHKARCKNLIKKGITIPPEERVPGIPLPNPKKPTVYPELYKKFILEKQKLTCAHFLEVNDLSTPDFPVGLNHPIENSLSITGSSTCSVENKETNSNRHAKFTNNLETENENQSAVTALNAIFHKNDNNSLLNPPYLKNDNLMLDVINSQTKVSNYGMGSPNDSVELSEKELKSEIRIIFDNELIKCSICCESFQSQYQLDIHLGTEVHLSKILELKMKGVSESEILSAIFSDRNNVKPSSSGKLTCSICTITLDSKIEFDDHLNSVFHKYTLKDYKMKKTLEVKNIVVSSNEQGLYFCKLCKEGWPSLLKYIQHLHSLKHRISQRAQRAKVILAKRRSSHLQKQRLKILKKKKALQGTDTKKNAGTGAAVDLQIGIQVPVPNLKLLESKTDFAKNLSQGNCKNLNDNIAPSYNNNNNNHNHTQIIHNRNKLNGDKLNETEIKKIQRSNRKNQNRGPYPNNTPLFMPPRNLIPSLLPFSSYHPRFAIPSYDPTNRSWAYNSGLYSPVSKPFFGRFTNSPYVRPPRFQRPPWPKYR